MKSEFSAWLDKNDDSLTVVAGLVPHNADDVLIEVFFAYSWDDAMDQWHRYNGWEPYKRLSSGAG
jgi:hypothetical protein